MTGGDSIWLKNRTISAHLNRFGNELKEGERLGFVKRELVKERNGEERRGGRSGKVGLLEEWRLEFRKERGRSKKVGLLAEGRLQFGKEGDGVVGSRKSNV